MARSNIKSNSHHDVAHLYTESMSLWHLWHATEPQTICHLIVREKVSEKHILGKYSNCNGFGVTMDLLNSHNFKTR